MTSTQTNSWLRNQRKTDLVEVAELIDLRNFENLKKSELEIVIDEHISKNVPRFAKVPKLEPYFASRQRAQGSPAKRESRESIKEEGAPAPRSIKRKSISKPTEDLASSNDESQTRATLGQIAYHTPRRGLARVAAQLPPTPAHIVSAVDRSTAAVRKRVHSIYKESGITEASHATRESLSTVNSIIFCVSVFELFFIRQEILANRYAFTIPAMGFLGTSDYPVYLPDLFLLLTTSFWSPALTWSLTSLVIPCVFGYFFNLSAASGSNGPRSRSKPHVSETVVDPLTFSIIKALISYIVYAQRVTMCGLLSEISIVRLNGAVYGGYRGMIVGALITGLTAMYDAVLRK